MEVTYDSAGVLQATITGYLKTIGVEEAVTFNIAANGEFKLNFGQDDRQFQLFKEAPAEGYLTAAAVEAESGKLSDVFRQNLVVSYGEFYGM